MKDRSKIGRRNKRFGSSEERRLAKKLTLATGLWFERQILSGADRRHQGDIVCNDSQMHYCEVKYRRALVNMSIRRGCQAVNKFIEQLPVNQTSLLIVVTGGGVNYRKKGMKVDWLFAKKNQVNRCTAFAGYHWLGESCHFPFHTYRPKPEWVFAVLDKALETERCAELFGINEDMVNYGIAIKNKQ